MKENTHKNLAVLCSCTWLRACSKRYEVLCRDVRWDILLIQSEIQQNIRRKVKVIPQKFSACYIWVIMHGDWQVCQGFFSFLFFFPTWEEKSTHLPSPWIEGKRILINVWVQLNGSRNHHKCPAFWNCISWNEHVSM